jgi:hypothetical protein
MNITDSAGAATDDGVQMTNVTGSPAMANDTITNAPHNGIVLDNTNTNVSSFNLSNATIQCQTGNACQPSGSTGNDALLVAMRGSSVLGSGSVTNSTFTGVRATGIQVVSTNTGRIGNASGGAIVSPVASNSFTVSGSSFTNNNIALDFSQSETSNMAFQILNNATITGSRSHAINVATAAGAATGPTSHFMVGKIDGNTIGTQGTKDSGSVIGNGIRGVIQGQNTQGSLTISNNTIREVVNADVITLVGQNGSATTGTGTAKFKVVNNAMPTPSGSNQSLCGPANTACALNGIFALADEAFPVCMVMTGNNIYDVTTMNGANDIELAERSGPPAGAQLTVEGTGGSNSTYIQANNTLAGPSKFLDESNNTSQVAAGACGTFPS